MESTKNEVTDLFWVIAGIAVVWNLMGAAAFLYDATLPAEAIAELPVGQQELYANNPWYNKLAYGVATMGGLLGSIGLLMRKKWSIAILLASLIGVLIWVIHNLGMTNVLEVMGNKAAALPLVIAAISLYLWYFAKKSARAGILK